MVHRDQQELLPENVMEQTDGAVEQRCLAHVGPGDSKNVANKHVFEMLGFSGGLAHQKDCRARGYSIGDTDEGFLRDMTPARTRKSEDGRALDNMHSEVGVNARQNKARDKGSKQEQKHFHREVSYLVVSNACLSFAML